MRGYFAIGIEGSKFERNVGTLWRSAQAFGASYIFTIGARYTKVQRSDTSKAYRHIPLFHYTDVKDFLQHRPRHTPIIGVETPARSTLPGYNHQERAIYVLGAEDTGLSEEMRAACNTLLEIPTSICLNVSTAGSIIMYDRASKLLNT